mmetsp:Transcript_30460/g.45076  ORF Transcript_30460/g.45076 Transcript_30460/m.45076 type:complete len:483 (+) Transcript_30460:518-1966(+)
MCTETPAPNVAHQGEKLSATTTKVNQNNKADVVTTDKNSKKADDYVVGRAHDNHKIFGSLRPKRKDGELKIGIDGKWYDCTKFAKHHPGGDIIWEYQNKDATVHFLAFHDRKLLSRVKATGKTYEFNRERPNGSVMDGDWITMSDKFEALGYNKVNLPFLYSRWAIVAACASWMFLHLYIYLNYSKDSSWAMLSFPLACIGLALVWQQAGFLLHDAMHNHHFRNRKLDQAFGQLYGIIFGISCRWWRDEHYEHHVFTNTYVEGVGVSDSQFQEDIWAQDFHILQFFPEPLRRFIVKYQQYYYLPALILIGNFGIRIDSILSTRRPLDLLNIALHFSWVGGVLTLFPTWQEAVIFYYSTCCFAGILAMQLLMSHIAEPFLEKSSVIDYSWSQRQVEAILDITVPWYMDWFCGGLNLHSPHHLFPRLNRCYYRKVYPEIEALCDKHNVKLDQLTFFGGLVKTLDRLGSIRDQYEEDSKAKEKQQ